ncbi:uncharacterized protein K452DRAFT_315167 [Aplosporella prunicola CBS 121167]|uniref:Uncharacterized protein n=1 Tax=Aplosporella prunicola CBS 121167 TaxID=1176127 RepID=A0A6A6BT71_9PEZI|nr:uncharacterized protein K452DRAFT_315167 [Aplosporella prunicola CBS 121167]KAF2146988.1 hypothetical protein K452DRAFT_315167 [Aplosporella prunicola CBS 121167]
MRGTLNTVNLVLSNMRRDKTMAALSSPPALPLTCPNKPCPSKAALIVGQVRSLRVVLRPEDITINAVARAIVYSAAAKESGLVEPYTKDTDVDVKGEGHWDGRVIFTQGERYTELEESLAQLEPQWLRIESTTMTRAQQALTDTRGEGRTL